MAKYIVGIDEVGRGPLAGPVMVGAVYTDSTNTRLLNRKLSGIRDSKLLSAAKRLYWYEVLRNMEKDKLIYICIKKAEPKSIDKEGIQKIIFKLIDRILTSIRADPTSSKILLDGSLRAPPKFLEQKTIIRGDQKIKIISAASVVAKVERDRVMVNYSKKHSKYHLEYNKGYGTKMHIQSIKKYGISVLHRKSFTDHLTSK